MPKNLPQGMEDIWQDIRERVSKYSDFIRDPDTAAWNTFKRFHFQDQDGLWKRKEGRADFIFTPQNMVSAYLAKESLKAVRSRPAKSDLEYELVSEAKIVERPEKYQDLDLDQIKASVPTMYIDDVENIDYVYCMNWLCHSDQPNKNRAIFTSRGLQVAMREGQLGAWMPGILDINHNIMPAIGTTIDAWMDYDDEAQANGIMVMSVIFAWGPYQTFAHDVVSAAKEDKLKFSMMCYPEFVECSKCGRVAKMKSELCEHIESFEAMVKHDAYTLIHYPQFFANSVILEPSRPADEYARPLALANLIDEDDIEELNSLIKSKGDEDMTLQEQLDAANAKIQELEASATASEKAVSDLEEANAKVESLEQQIADLTKERDNLQIEVDKIDEEKAKAKVAGRVEQVAKVVELEDSDKEIVQKTAERLDDEEWDAYVSTLSKYVKKDPEVEASEKLGTTGGGSEEKGNSEKLKDLIKDRQ